MVHRATYAGVGEFEEEVPGGAKSKYEKSVKLECFPPAPNSPPGTMGKLLLIHDFPYPLTYWYFDNVSEEQDDNREEKIDGSPNFAQGSSTARIDLYQEPAVRNEAEFQAELRNYNGRDWKIKFRGIQIEPL